MWLIKARGNSESFASVPAVEVFEHEKINVQQWVSRSAKLDEVFQIYENVIERVSISRLNAIFIT